MTSRGVKHSQEIRQYLALERRAQEEGLDVHELEQWRKLKRILERRLGSPSTPKDASEQRRSLRILFSLKVVFKTQEELTTSLMQNISRGGFYIETKEPLPLGTVFTTHIEIEEWRLSVNPTVRVVSTHASADFSSRRAGMGVAFHELSEADKQTIDEIYELCLGIALQRREEDEVS